MEQQDTADRVWVSLDTKVRVYIDGDSQNISIGTGGSRAVPIGSDPQDVRADLLGEVLEFLNAASGIVKKNLKK